MLSAAAVYAGQLAMDGELGAVNCLAREVARNPGATNRFLVHVGVLACAAAAVATGVFLLVLRVAGGVAPIPWLVALGQRR